jgi:predicted dehydrogenase
MLTGPMTPATSHTLAIDACRRFGVVLALGENNRFWPNMQEMQGIVASDELGEPMHIGGHTGDKNSERGA